MALSKKASFTVAVILFILISSVGFLGYSLQGKGLAGLTGAAVNLPNHVTCTAGQGYGFEVAPPATTAHTITASDNIVCQSNALGLRTTALLTNSKLDPMNCFTQTYNPYGVQLSPGKYYFCVKIIASQRYFLMEYNLGDTISFDWAEQIPIQIPTCTDVDSDGYGARGTDLSVCAGSATVADCNDADTSISPSAQEYCDGKDNNCDNLADEGGVCDTIQNCGAYGNTCPTDPNGAPMCTNGVCSLICNSGYNLQDGACVPDIPACVPAAEICGDEIDQDCDGADLACATCTDKDGDGYGSVGTDLSVCTGSIAIADCDDNSASMNPGVPELCDGLDNNCDANTDEGGVCNGNDLNNCGSFGAVCAGDACISGVCMTSQACYTGPTSTEGVGSCKAGTKLCASDGTCGVCVGEVLPVTAGFSCINQEADVNCNSQKDYLEDACTPACPEGTIFDNILKECIAPIAPIQCNNIIETGEQCDDGNIASGDGCSATCQTEAPACIPMAEVCDGIDNDCNDLTDEGGVCDTIQNCGTYGNACPANPNSYAICTEGVCGKACGDGYELVEGVCNSLCGNGVINADEQCDGTNLNEKTCANYVEGSTGTLICNADCTVGTASCSVNFWAQGAEVSGEANSRLFTEYKFKAKQRINSPQLSFSSLDAKPETAPAQDNVYKYEAVLLTNFADADLENVALKFAVEKSWLASNNLDESKVKLNRLENEVWASYDATIVSEDDTNIIYSANLPGLSTYSVTSEPLPSQPSAADEGGGASASDSSSGGGGSSSGSSGGGGGGSYSSGGIMQNVLSSAVAGNGICEKGESAANVCSDCSCASGYACTDDGCALASLNKVSSQTDNMVKDAKLPNKLFGSKTHFKVPGILAGLGGLTVLIILAGFIKSHKRNATKTTTQESVQPEPKHKSSGLKSYVAKELAEGYSKDKVKERLAEAGWPEDKIDSAFKSK